jgi:dTDP-4-dehydrorhamnose 3,5-epimerase
MIFTETALPGAYVLDLERLEDERGFFARTWCAREFAAHGLSPCLAQSSVSFSRRAGTLRGMHYQAAPHEEEKLVRCTQGAIFDVIIDLRPESSAFGRHVGLELSAATHRALYVPKGVAHGFQTLADDTTVFYQMSEFHAPGAGQGVRWDDPAFGVRWPIAHPILNERDASYPDFRGGA